MTTCTIVQLKKGKILALCSLKTTMYCITGFKGTTVPMDKNTKSKF